MRLIDMKSLRLSLFTTTYLLTPCAALAATVQAFTNPSTTGPNIVFNTGQVVNGLEQYNARLPTAPGGTDKTWSLTQWAASQYLDPTKNQASGNTSDPILGTQVALYQSSDLNSALRIYKGASQYTYELQSINSPTANPQDTYLQNIGYPPNTFTLNHPMIFTANERLAGVSGSGSYTQVQNDVVVGFNIPGSPNYRFSLPTITGFLQFILSDNNNTQSNSTYFSYDSNSAIFNLGKAQGSPNEALPWVSETGNLHAVTIDLNSATQSLAQTLASCAGCKTNSYASDLTNLSNWTVEGTYIGVESQNGSGATVDVANPAVTMDPTTTYNGVIASKIISVNGGKNWSQINAPQITGVPASVIVPSGTTTQLFPGSSVTWNKSWLNATMTVSLTSAAGTLYPGFGYGVTTSSDNGTITFTGSPSLMSRVLSNLSIVPATVGRLSATYGGISVVVTDPDGSVGVKSVSVTVRGAGL